MEKKTINTKKYSVDDDKYVMTNTIKVSDISQVYIDTDDDNDYCICIEISDERSNNIYLDDDSDIFPTYFNIMKAIQKTANKGIKSNDEYLIILGKDVYLLSEIIID